MAAAGPGRPGWPRPIASPPPPSPRADTRTSWERLPPLPEPPAGVPQPARACPPVPLGAPCPARGSHPLGGRLCPQVDLAHMACREPEPQPLAASREHLQGEETSEPEEAGGGPARSQVSSPSVATSSASRQPPTLEGKTGAYFSSLDSSIDILKKRAQELIESINESRQKDHALMTNFRDSLKKKVSDLTEKLEERMYQLYDHHNRLIQEKLQEFTQKMANISHLETELKQVCHSVETVYKDLYLQPEAVPSAEQSHKDGEC